MRRPPNALDSGGITGHLGTTVYPEAQEMLGTARCNSTTFSRAVERAFVIGECQCQCCAVCGMIALCSDCLQCHVRSWSRNKGNSGCSLTWAAFRVVGVVSAADVALNLFILPPLLVSSQA
jgi:hypothetical protein